MSWSDIFDRIKNDGEKGSDIIRQEIKKYLQARQKVKELEEQLNKAISESNNAMAVISHVKKLEEIREEEFVIIDNNKCFKVTADGVTEEPYIL